MPCFVYCRTVLHNIKVDIISNSKYHRTRSIFLFYDRIGVVPTSMTGWVWWTDWCVMASVGVFHKSLTSRISKISFKTPLKLWCIAIWSIYIFHIRRTTYQSGHLHMYSIPECKGEKQRALSDRNVLITTDVGMK